MLTLSPEFTRSITKAMLFQRQLLGPQCSQRIDPCRPTSWQVIRRKADCCYDCGHGCKCGGVDDTDSHYQACEQPANAYGTDADVIS